MKFVLHILTLFLHCKTSCLVTSADFILALVLRAGVLAAGGAAEPPEVIRGGGGGSALSIIKGEPYPCIYADCVNGG